ncbi:MAG: sensor histidine kinase [Anaerolineae bacterium]|nr:MAG: sensor histidine kinase [Anaerolineae bacterium]
MSQVLRNLLDNAITHTPPGGQITVTARQSGTYVEVSVHDTGSGISYEHLPYVFDRFYRADPSRARATGGAGLGLAIVKQLVEAHGGRAWVRSTVGQGRRSCSPCRSLCSRQRPARPSIRPERLCELHEALTRSSDHF